MKTEKELQPDGSYKRPTQKGFFPEELLGIASSFFLDKKSKIGICPVCGLYGVKLTKDHIVPKTILKAIPWKKLGYEKSQYHKNIQWMCAGCNNAKGAEIDANNPFSREYWTRVRDYIDEKLSYPQE